MQILAPWRFAIIPSQFRGTRACSPTAARERNTCSRRKGHPDSALRSRNAQTSRVHKRENMIVHTSGARCDLWGYHFIGVTATEQPVRRLLTIFACLMLVFSLETTAAAHVLERPDASISAHESRAEQIAEAHTSDDVDQVPADSDKGYPHHHGGCHGDHVGAPVKLAIATLTRDLRLLPVSASRSMQPLSTADPALRPPQA